MKREEIKKVVIIGSGPIIIGQAAEFDYAGTQACRALREEGVEVVLINSNPATIMTDKQIADKVYIEPLTTDTIKKVILKEKPDSILPTLGGQNALNLAVELEAVSYTHLIPKHLESISAKLEEMGVSIEEYDDSIRVTRNQSLNKCNIKTMPHPGFPTDMQPQLSVLLSMAEGTSIVTENVWGNRFRYIDELRRMGMKAVVDGQVAVFEGGCKLTGAPVMATDLRAGAAMVIAAMAAQGQSEIENIYHIERGYENIVEKLTALGADIKRITVPDETPKAAARVS